jgi:hypothetical protein
VPEIVAVPLPLSCRVSPPGRAPVSLIAGAGEPVVVTEKLKAAPTVAVAVALLVTPGAWLTVMIKLCVELATEFFAVIVTVETPAAVGVPEMVPVPVPPVKVSPFGSVPVCVIVGVGEPLAVIAKLNAVPTVALAVAALVIVGAGAADTTSVKLWVAFGLLPLAAVIVIGKLVAAPAGVPAMVAVPSPLLVKVTPAGSAPDSVSVLAGNPVVVIVTELLTPFVNEPVAALVMAGAWSMLTMRA